MNKIALWTRMHSSKLRTIRILTVFRGVSTSGGLHPGGRGGDSACRGGLHPGAFGQTPSLCKQNDWQTCVKHCLSPNFVCVLTDCDQVFVLKIKTVHNLSAPLVQLPHTKFKSNDHKKYTYLLYKHLVTMATMMTIKGRNTDTAIPVVFFHSPKIIMQW